MNEKRSISENAKLNFTARQREMRNTLTEEPSHPLIERIKISLKQNNTNKGGGSPTFRSKCSSPP